MFVPRGMAHRYRNEQTSAARMAAVYTPAGMEGWFREVCTAITDDSETAPPITEEPIARMLEAGPRHHVEWAI
jgi:hypothetical protein